MQSETSDTLSGTIDRFLFQDLESGYGVFVVTQGTNTVTVKGTIPSLQTGQEVVLYGTWVLDPKYGRQFAATSCRSTAPNSITGLKKFLGSGLIKGIGKSYAEKLVNRFGTQILDIIDKHPERLREVEGIGPKRIELIASAWKDQQEIAEVMVFLQDKGVSPGLAGRIYKKYRQNTIASIQQNPYRLAEEVWGIGFKTADEIAQKMGFGINSRERITAGILFALTSAMQQGHLYVEVTDLKKQTVTLLALEETDEIMATIKRALHDLYEQNKIKLVSTTAGHFLATARSYRAEQDVARILTRLNEGASTLQVSINSLYNELRTATDIHLTDNQITGILTCLQHKVTIITGGPGTGKTTLIKKLLSILDAEKIRYKLTAPTGRAAKRITESTGRPAATIHRLLDFDPMSMSFKHTEGNALDLDFLIVDESSMIDIFLAQALIKAIPHNAHLVLLGDIDQLPSVGAGNVLNDCIASEKIPCIRLNTVFRQAQDSLIIVNAHRVNRGEFPVSQLPDSRKDFLFIKEEHIENVPQHLKKILFSTLAQQKISPENTMILTPMNRSGAGTQALNQHLQNLLNPGPRETVIFGGTHYKLGDRVMQIRNNYDKFVFNGDIGTIESINKEDRLIGIQFGGRVLEYDFSDLSELVLAYAITIHKSQGSEYSAVIIPLFTQHFTLLQRNLLYTAITRAKNMCIIIGQPKALGMALGNNKSVKRVTFLHKFIQEGATNS